jgi:formate dehydrogenase
LFTKKTTHLCLQGVRETLECWFDGKPIRDEYLIMQDGKLAGVGAHSYSEGGTTGGSEESADFTKGGGNV